MAVRMYNPKAYQPGDASQAEALIRENPFATLIACTSDDLDVGHLPLILEKRATGNFLIGHMARANPMWRMLEETRMTAIFHGPQAYVTPNWYPDPADVPTWYYLVVHVRGRAQILPDPKDALRVLRKSVEFFERSEPQPWILEQAGSLTEELLPAIMAFEISMDEVEAKFKLGQNRGAEERDGAMRGLSRRGDWQSKEVLRWMGRLGL